MSDFVADEQLKVQIEKISEAFAQLQYAASGVDSENKVPDSVEQLDEVLQNTEKATSQIIADAMEMQSITDESTASDEVKQQIASKVTSILESCTFQDISGQRIKKVMECLDVLKQRIEQLESIALANGEAADGHQKVVGVIPHRDDPENLKNGPQKEDVASSQDDVDKYFS